MGEAPADAGRTRAADFNAAAAAVPWLPVLMPALPVPAACRAVVLARALLLRTSVRLVEKGRRASVRGGFTKADRLFFLH